MRRLLLLFLPALTVLALLPSAAMAADGPTTLKLKPKHDFSPLGNERLSNERTVSRWGHTNLLGGIREEPSMASKSIGKLRWNTEDGLPEVYLVLESRLDDDGEVWLKIRIPRRPNGATGWVREEQISNLKVVTTHLTIDRTKLRATLRKGGKVVWTSPVGVGAPGTPTPGGQVLDPRAAARTSAAAPSTGPWAFGTAAYSDS